MHLIAWPWTISKVVFYNCILLSTCTFQGNYVVLYLYFQGNCVVLYCNSSGKDFPESWLIGHQPYLHHCYQPAVSNCTWICVCICICNYIVRVFVLALEFVFVFLIVFIGWLSASSLSPHFCFYLYFFSPSLPYFAIIRQHALSPNIILPAYSACVCIYALVHA